jgi:hypothetical protein
MKRIAALALAATLLLSGCNYLATAQKASGVVAAVLAVAQAEAPAVPAADQAIYNSYVALGVSLQKQLDQCVNTAASKMLSKKGTFLACFNTFAAGINSPGEMAQLRLLSPSTQAKVQLYVVAIVTGVNVALQFFGGTQVTSPVLTAAPSAAQLDELADRIGYRGAR